MVPAIEKDPHSSEWSFTGSEEVSIFTPFCLRLVRVEARHGDFSFPRQPIEPSLWELCPPLSAQNFISAAPRWSNLFSVAGDAWNPEISYQFSGQKPSSSLRGAWTSVKLNFLCCLAPWICSGRWRSACTGQPCVISPAVGLFIQSYSFRC